MKYIKLKIITTSILIGISVLASARALAFFFADDTDAPVVLFAGEIDIQPESSDDFSPTVKPDTQASRTVAILATTTAETGFAVRVENASGSLCPGLLLSYSNQISPVQASGTLIGFSATTSPAGDWPLQAYFSASLVDSDTSWQNQFCDFDLVFETWQDAIGYGAGGFTDREILKSSIRSSRWKDDPVQAGPGDIVINEIMWPGSQEGSDDQWIELLNMTVYDISLGDLKLENVLNNRGTINFPDSAVIPAGGFFLIGRYHASNPGSFLAVDPDLVHGNFRLKADGNGVIVLRSKGGIVIDSAKGDIWPAGKNVQVWQSMERDYSPGDGLDPASWHTATDDYANDVSFWDREDLTFGTPKKANSASADSTHPGISLVFIEVETSANRSSPQFLQDSGPDAFKNPEPLPGAPLAGEEPVEIVDLAEGDAEIADAQILPAENLFPNGDVMIIDTGL